MTIKIYMTKFFETIKKSNFRDKKIYLSFT